jgi:outer membrane protein
MGPLPALADTIEAALVRAYQNNPQLNARDPNLVQRQSDRQQNASRGKSGPGAREGLRVLEEAVLLSAATIYMDYLRHRLIAKQNHVA